MTLSELAIGTRRAFIVLGSETGNFLLILWLYVWDVGLALVNVLTPSRERGHVIPPGDPGFAGRWPAYAPPGAGAARSPCPALNTMANHGIIPRDGRGVRFTDVADGLVRTYHVARPMALLLATQATRLLGRDYARGTFDLADVCAHNMIEHDGSFTRDNIYNAPNQAAPSPALVEALLARGTDASKGMAGPRARARLCAADLARTMGRRRAECKAADPQFSLSLAQKLAGSSNASQILNVFGGDVEDLRAFLLEERLREGWEPRARGRMGLTILGLNLTLLRVELGVREEVDGSLKGVMAHSAEGVSEAKQAGV